ncbi:MAG: transglutaminase-like domain-containing protein [Candidatus Bathyarchaeia archaeon]|jgi:predicted transglutaminase-like protease
MEIKQILVKIAEAVKRLSKFESRMDHKFVCWWGGYCPTVKEIEDSAVKSLANRLKGQSHEETLTNILEWQDRNITFWTERHPLSTIFFPFFVSLIVYGVFVAPRIIVASAPFMALNSTLVIVFWLLWIPIAILITGTILTLTIIILIIHSNRKIPLKEGLEALNRSIPINLLLKNKLGVCRDYAKLTACLLLNIYPNDDLYFAHAPSHVATGIMIENRLYMLDQRLPILTIDKWKSYRHSKEKKIEKIKKDRLIKVDFSSFLSKTKIKAIDTQKLAKTMAKFLNIQQQTGSKEISELKILLRKGVILYEDDEMVNYSLSRWLRNKISTELVNIDQVTKLEITSQKDDLMFLISFSTTN